MTSSRTSFVGTVGASRARPLVAFLVTLLATSAVAVGWAAHGRQVALADRSTYDVTWIASQTSVEYGRLATAVVARAAGDAGVSATEPGLRLDVLAARVSDFGAPDFREFLASDPTAAAAAARVEAEMPTLRRLVEEVGPEGTTRTVDVPSRVGSLFGPLARLAGAAHRYGLAQAEAGQAGVSALYAAFVALTASMTTCCVALVLRLLRVNRIVSAAAYTDALTGLANRARLSREMAARLAEARGCEGRVAVLCLDLDRFKPVNDAFGHAVGDALLTQVARRLGALVTDRDLVARLGGDEFVILQGGDPDGAAAATLAARVVKTVSAPFALGRWDVRVGTSVGVALFPDDGPTADDLLRGADAALYRAKRAGVGWLAVSDVGGRRDRAA